MLFQRYIYNLIKCMYTYIYFVYLEKIFTIRNIKKILFFLGKINSQIHIHISVFISNYNFFKLKIADIFIL